MRKGNPKGIKDWDDLVKPDVEVITPNPKTSGGARWNYLAAWGYALKRELGDLAKLHDPEASRGRGQGAGEGPRVRQGACIGHVKVLDSGARGATMTFVQNGRGDVLLAWENEAFYSVNRHEEGRTSTRSSSPR